MNEIWKPVIGYENRYAVSNKGRVKSLPFMQSYLLRNGKPALRKTRECIISQQTNNAGYRLVHLHLDGERTAKTVHRLVLSAFVGEGAQEINHKDGNKENNRIENLEYVTPSGNKIHAVAIGLNKQANAVAGRNKISGEEIIYPSGAEAAFKLTGKRGNSTKISACLNGKRLSAFGCTWRHV